MHFPAKRVSVLIECFGTLEATYTATGLDVSWPTFVQSLSLLATPRIHSYLSSLLVQLRIVSTLEPGSTHYHQLSFENLSNETSDELIARKILDIYNYVPEPIGIPS